MESTSNTDKTYKLIIDIIREMLQDQFQVVRALDNKIGIVIGFTGVIITLSFILTPHSRLSFILYLLGLILLFLSLISFFFALKTKAYARGLKLEVLVDQGREKSLKEFQEKYMAACRDSYEENKKYIEIKAKIFNYGLTIIFAGLILISFSNFVKIGGFEMSSEHTKTNDNQERQEDPKQEPKEPLPRTDQSELEYLREGFNGDSSEETDSDN